MNLSKLGKRLKREAIANPKKATILGLVAIVALYYWLPLIWGWFGRVTSSETSAPSTASASTGQTAAAFSTTLAAGETALKPAPATVLSNPNQPTWEQVASWMEADSRTKAGPALQNIRDPFATDAAEGDGEQPEGTVAAKSRPLAITPETAGLTLTGTLISPDRRVAQISGKSYKEGETIVVSKPSLGGSIAFTLIEIQPRRVALQLGEERYELAMPEASSDKIEITPFNQ